MPITLTEKAAAEVKRIVDEQKKDGSLQGGEKVYLRLSVKGGGCSGFQHKLDLDMNYNEKSDQLMELHGVPVVVDRKSLLYVDGAIVDFVSDLNRHGFKVENPSARNTCGCGSSFSM